MTHINICAYASPGEVPVLDAALSHLSLSLEGEASTVAYQRVESREDLVNAPTGTVRLVSLQPELEDLDVSWPRLEQDLRDFAAKLSESGDPVLIQTVFRLVGPDKEETRNALLVRIRRLDCLAADLSREFGAFVIDLDRVLADIGGASLATDYRLQGEQAAKIAGHALAMGIASNALDAYMPFEAQERVLSSLTAQRPALNLTSNVTPGNLISLGKGKRRQQVATNMDAQQENHVGWLIRQVLSRQIGPAEAMDRLIKAIQRRGIGDSLGILFAGLSQALSPRKQA